MKKLLAVLIGFFTILLVGCGKNETPDNKIYGEQNSKDYVLQVVDSNKAPVQVYGKEVLISPTWGQSNKYASERKDFDTWQILGLISLLLFVVVLYGKAKEASWFPDWSSSAVGILLAALLIGALVSFKWQASSIKWNNDKWVKKEVYDKAIKESGSTKPIWDSLRRECRITSGPYECYEK